MLRQLKFVETIMFRGGNPYSDQSTQLDPSEPLTADVEVILMDML